MLTIVFLIIAYVLLLNNLIALFKYVIEKIYFIGFFFSFSFTIQRVHGESQRARCYHFFVVLKEYEDKDMFVPPFNLLLLPLSLFIRKSNRNFIEIILIILNLLNRISK